MSTNKYGAMPQRLATHCHVCGDVFRDQEVMVEHSGATMVCISGQETNGHGSIVMHPECATILAMRLLSDVIEAPSEYGERVVDTLAKVREAYQMK